MTSLLPTRWLTDELSHRFLLIKIASKRKVLFFFRLHTQENVYASFLQRKLLWRNITPFSTFLLVVYLMLTLCVNSRKAKNFLNKFRRTYVKLSTLSVTRMINQSQDSHSPSRGTYIFKYRQSSEWLVSMDFILRSWANRPLGISNNASMPVSDTGTLWGHTGEKWSAKRVFFHVEGVTGGMYLQTHKYRQRKEKKRMRNESFFAAAALFISGSVDFVLCGNHEDACSKQVGVEKTFYVCFGVVGQWLLDMNVKKAHTCLKSFLRAFLLNLSSTFAPVGSKSPCQSCVNTYRGNL